MPDPIYSNVVNLLQLAIMLLIPLEILLAATLRIKADYEMRDTLATMMVSVGSICLWGVLGCLFFGGVLLAYAHRLFNIPFTWWTFAIAFLLEDWRYYLWPRISHRSRWLSA